MLVIGGCHLDRELFHCVREVEIVSKSYEQDSREWRMASECTFSGALELFRSRNPFVWFPAALLGHFALEQLLKSALLESGCRIEKFRNRAGNAWGHNLVELAEVLASKRPDFPIAVYPDLAVFDAFFEELRYPRALEKVMELSDEHGALLVILMESIRPFAASVPGQ